MKRICWKLKAYQGATIDRTLGHSHRISRVLVRSVAGCNDRLIVPSVAVRHDLSYIGR